MWHTYATFEILNGFNYRYLIITFDYDFPIHMTIWKAEGSWACYRFVSNQLQVKMSRTVKLLSNRTRLCYSYVNEIIYWIGYVEYSNFEQIALGISASLSHESQHATSFHNVMNIPFNWYCCNL